MRALSFVSLAFPILAIGCGGGGAPIAQSSSDTTIPAVETSGKAHIWGVPGAPLPLDEVRLTPGEQARISLIGSVAGAKIQRIQAIEDPNNVLAVGMDMVGQAAILRGLEGGGRTTIKATTETASGEFRTVHFPVVVEPLPISEFVYEPPAGTDPSTVALAGDFNGWNSGSDLFEKGDDGVFRLKKAIGPGTWKYKLVVDGEWMADPANPKMEEGGYGNSLLEVEGELVEKFEFAMLNAGMTGAGPQGGMKAYLRPGETLLADTVTLIANNNLLGPANYEIDANEGIVRWNVPADSWYEENFVYLSAETSEGRVGTRGIFFTGDVEERTPRDEVIYFAFTDRFFDGDPSLNRPSDDERLHPTANYMGGDWPGIQQKIEEGYFDQLGVTTIWISPVNKNTPKVEQESIEPGRYFTSYHGYWPISFMETNEQFGSMAKLQDMVNAAHDNDIAVLIDFVANHVHEDHPLIQENPDWSTELKLPNGENNIRLFDAHPFTTWFDTFLPTLNYEGNDEIKNIMVENAIYWMEEAGVDGIRQDAVKHIPIDFWRQLTLELYEEFPDRHVYQVGETISGYGTINEFVSPDLLTGQFDFPSYFRMRDVLAYETAPMSNLEESLLAAEIHYPAGAVMSPLIGNHDVSRFLGYADGDLEPGVDEKEIGYTNPPVVDDPMSYRQLSLAHAWLMSMPGAPMMYYGDEIGMTGAHDPDNRRLMPWEDWSIDQKQVLNRVSALTKARHESIALRRGNTEILLADDERIVYTRVSLNETVIIALARKPETDSVTVVLPKHWGEGRVLEDLVNGGIDATLDGSRLRLTDGEYTYGYWRLK